MQNVDRSPPRTFFFSFATHMHISLRLYCAIITEKKITLNPAPTTACRASEKSAGCIYCCLISLVSSQGNSRKLQTLQHMHHAAGPVLPGREAQLQHHPGAHQLPPAQCSRSAAAKGEQIVNASALFMSRTLIQTIRSGSWEKREWLNRREDRVQSIDVII